MVRISVSQNLNASGSVVFHDGIFRPGGKI
jgi:hypothetical protein